MLDRFRGGMLGAAIGDAPGKPKEITSPNLQKMRYGYRHAYKGHPNAMLQPGQCTDDTQIIIVAATLLTDGRFNDERYIAALRDLYERGGMRFPDGSVAAACEHMIRDEPTSVRLRSTTAGCLSIAIPCAPAYPGMYEGTERVVRACNVTHTHGAAHAAASTLTVLIYHAVNGMQMRSPRRSGRHSLPHRSVLQVQNIYCPWFPETSLPVRFIQLLFLKHPPPAIRDIFVTGKIMVSSGSIDRPAK